MSHSSGSFTQGSQSNTLVQTTIGELVEAVTEIAFTAGRTQDECYKLASLTLEKILQEKRMKDLLS